MTPARIPASDPPDPRARRVVLIVFLTVFLDLIGFGIIIPFLPLYVQSMGGSAQTVGFLFGCFSATQLVATPILGRISDRFGRRRVILLSLAGNAASMVLFAVASHVHFLPLLFASRILAGATAGNIGACQAAVADVTHGDARAKGMGRIGAGIGLGMVLGPVLGATASRLGMEAPPLAAAALATLDLLAALFLMPETHPPGSAAASPAAPRRDRFALRALLGDSRIVAVFALYFLTFLYMTTLQVALPLLGKERFDWTQVEIGNVFTLFGLLGMIVQGLLIGRMTKAFGANNLVIGGALSSLTGLSMIAAGHTAPMVVLGLALLGLGLGVTNPILSTLASTYAGPERQGMVLGFAQSAGGIARTVGPIASGFLYKQVGPGAAFVGGAASALAALVLGVGVRAGGVKVKEGRAPSSA